MKEWTWLQSQQFIFRTSSITLLLFTVDERLRSLSEDSFLRLEVVDEDIAI